MLIKPPPPKGKLDTVTVNGPEDVPDWDAIDWRVHEGNVGRLQRRIFKATREKHPQRPRGLLEPCAATSRMHGSEMKLKGEWAGDSSPAEPGSAVGVDVRLWL